MISNKTISLDPNLWGTKRKTRKRTTSSSTNKKTDDLKTKEFDNQFNFQLDQLNSLNAMTPQLTQPTQPAEQGAFGEFHLPQEPPYGNLKNGNKPTYRTLKQSIAPTPTNQSVVHHLGKNNRKKTASICIQGKKSRRKLKKYMKSIDHESLTDMKNHLYKNSLIKCGSAAPPDVIKEIYKNTKLTGAVSNTNGDVLVHNFINSPDSF